MHLNWNYFRQFKNKTKQNMGLSRQLIFRRFFLKMVKRQWLSTYNEGKSVVAERFIRTLKNKIFKHMTAV